MKLSPFQLLVLKALGALINLCTLILVRVEHQKVDATLHEAIKESVSLAFDEIVDAVERGEL